MRDWLAEAARTRPDHSAVEADDGTSTYAELDERASELARRLRVSDGQAVPAAARATLGFAALLHALPRRGAALEPLPPADQAPGVPLGEAQPVKLRNDHPTEAVHTVIRTSGTTGSPKRVELTFANHAAGVAAAADAVGLDHADRWLCPLPLHHVGGLNVLVRCAAHATTAVLHERFDADRVRAVLEAGEVTLASLVPTMLARLRHAGLRRAPNLRAIALGGGPIPAGLLEWADEAGIPVVPVYGMTETCSQVVAGVPGRPLTGAELKIGAGEEILVRGPMVSPTALAADGWLHTGDRGRLDGEGRLHVQGRLKDLIVTGGENVSPADVEQALLAHPAVSDAAVVGLPDEDWGEAVSAFVVLETPTSPTELIEWCRPRLAAHAIPKRVEPVEGLPRNAAGKLLRDQVVP